MSLPTSTAELQTERDRLRLKHELITLQMRDNAYERALRVSELELNHVGARPTQESALSNTFVDPYTWRNFSHFGAQNRLFYLQDDRRDGQFEPFITTLQDLTDYRRMARVIGNTNPWIVGLRGDLANYVIGQGGMLKATSDTGAAAALVKRVDQYCRTLLDENKWDGIRDREAFDRWRFDGQALLRLKDDASDPIPRLRFIEPAWLREPGLAYEIEQYLEAQHPGIDFDFASWSFGIHTRSTDHETHLGYFVEMTEDSADWEYVPATEIEYWKANTPLAVKPGLTDLFCIAPYAQKAVSLWRAILASSTEQASIAGITTYEEGVTATGAETMIARTATRSTNRTANHHQSGEDDAHWKHVPDGRQFHYGPLGNANAPVFLQVHSASLRCLGVRWSAPEFLTSSDASNANYASTLVSQSPFVKHVQNAQHVHGVSTVSMLWKALRLAYRRGYFAGLVSSFADLRRAVNLQWIPPDVATDDAQSKMDETQRRLDLMREGAMSLQTVQQEEGLDPADEANAKQSQRRELAGAAESFASDLFNRQRSLFEGFE